MSIPNTQILPIELIKESNLAFLSSNLWASSDKIFPVHLFVHPTPVFLYFYLFLCLMYRRHLWDKKVFSIKPLRVLQSSAFSNYTGYITIIHIPAHDNTKPNGTSFGFYNGTVWDTLNVHLISVFSILMAKYQHLVGCIAFSSGWGSKCAHLCFYSPHLPWLPPWAQTR